MSSNRALYYILTLIFLVSCEDEKHSLVREVRDFNQDWKFDLGEQDGASEIGFDDTGWRELSVPHDWSIEGEFSETNPTKPEAGALPAGIAWYRKHFRLPDDYKDKAVWIEFDGVFKNSEVWINGHFLGKRPNGYISFSYDLSPYLRLGEEENIIAVKVDNSAQPNSRWYTGSGIYRNVRVVATEKLRVDQWGTFVTTPSITKDSASVHLEVTVKNDFDSNKGAKVVSTILDAENKEVARQETETEISGSSSAKIDQNFTVTDPKLWDVEDPYLYKVVTEVYYDEQQTDYYETPLGIRFFQFHPEEGFSLNGKPMKILGVNLHHDLGALGAAVNINAIRRQLEIMREMGVNAIRTAHNPPAPELLQLTDEMGFIVQDEAYDMWKKKKNDEDYHKHWDDWHEQDLKDFIRRDRNHPSVLMWSIGNEIREQFDSTGIEITRELVKIVKDLDTTRPVTSALSENIPEKNFIFKSGALDLLGFNYKHADYENFPEWYPSENIIITESASALATRGHYDMPSDSLMFWPPAHNAEFDGNHDYTVSAYDHVAAYWGATHEDSWNAVKKYDFISGVFVWAGIDYLGEPIPYPYPARSSYLGLVDLAGFPKDTYYMYQSEWSDDPVLHVFPHWNWEEGQEVDVWAYYNNADEVELFLNGRSLGTKSKKGEELHISWRVSFQPGTITAVSRKNGEVVLEKEIHTASEANQVKLSPEKDGVNSDGTDLIFVTVEILDEKGNLVPNADNLVNFEVSGGGKIVGVDNGYQASLEPFKADYRKAFKGKCLVIIQSNGNKENVNLKATAAGLHPAEINIPLVD